jgi:hypothetical protein
METTLTDAAELTEESAAEDAAFAATCGEVLGFAEVALAAQFGGEVRLRQVDVLREPRYRSAVLRCAVEQGPAGLDQSVVVKHSLIFEPDEAKPRRNAASRFAGEVAGLRFLESLAIEPPVAPRVLAGEAGSRTFVMEDLGAGKALSDFLLDSDRDLAIRSLDAYARTLGRIHAASFGGERAWLDLGSDERKAGRLELFDDVERVAGDLGLALPAGWAGAVRDISATVRDPQGPRAFTITDACPDNHFVVGDAVQFFDLEFAGYDFAFLEAAYLQVPFPTCWCHGLIPPEIEGEAVGIYRAEVVGARPELADESAFARAMRVGVCYWAFRSAAWMTPRAMEKDEEWGRVSPRTRIVRGLEAFAGEAADDEMFRPLVALATDWASHLRGAWPEHDFSFGPYPAFA